MKQKYRQVCSAITDSHRAAVRSTSDGRALLSPWTRRDHNRRLTRGCARSRRLPAARPTASAPTPATTPAAAAVPLRGPKGPAQALMSAGYSLGIWDLQHFMVLLRSDPARAQALVFDFQPRDPEDALAAFAVLSQSKIPGVVRRRTLRRVPNTRCWLVGHHRGGDGDAAVRAADTFSARWPTDLVVGRHDCRDFTNGLVEVLTGEKRVLDALRSSAANGESDQSV